MVIWLLRPKTIMFADEMPDRFFQMGVAEQNMFSMAAGLATVGFIPFASSFACFVAKRSLDQIRTSIAQPRLNVKMVGAYSGLLTGKTGKTHQTVQDIAVFRSMPYITTIAPVDGLEVRQAMTALVEFDGPVYLRLTRDPCPVVLPEDYEFRIGRAVSMRDGGDVTLIGTGQLTQTCLEAAGVLGGEGIECSILHVPTLKPLDEEAIIQAAPPDRPGGFGGGTQHTGRAGRRRGGDPGGKLSAPHRKGSGSGTSSANPARMKTFWKNTA